MKSKVICTCTMETSSCFLIIICAVLVYNTDFTNCAPTEINSQGKDHVTGVYPTTTTTKIAPTTMTTTTMTTTMPMTSAKSWSSQKPSRSKHITKSNLYKKPSKDKGGWAKVPFLSSTLVPTGYDVEKDISRHKEAPVVESVTSTTTTATTAATTIDTVVDNVNGPKDYTNKNSTNTSSLRHFDSPLSLGVSDLAESISSTNVNGDVNSGKDIDFISDSSTTKADETYATTVGYHAKAAAIASSTTTMQSSRAENPVSKPIPMKHDEGVGKSISSFVAMTYTPIQTKSMPVNASLSLSIPLTTTTTHPPQKQLDVGHDGVKITKKKQLFDKHFIAASNPSGSLHPSIKKDNSWPPLSKNKPTKGYFGGSGGKKLMEVPNGYLGPIMMKEKTFSVSHPGKKPKPSLVEQQLKDKKLVEIIAPTALMEPITKVKSSQPDFVAIDNNSAVTMATTSTTSTTTERSSSSTEKPLLVKSKKKEIVSETATTYFLVVTQENQASSKEIASETVRTPIEPEMEPLNSGEIETTLREIYAEVISAMEGGSKAKSTSTDTVITERNSNDVTTFLPPKFSEIDYPPDYNRKTLVNSELQELTETHQHSNTENEEVSKRNQMKEDSISSSERPLVSKDTTPLEVTLIPTDPITISAKNFDWKTISDFPMSSTENPLTQFSTDSTIQSNVLTKNDVSFEQDANVNIKNGALTTETPKFHHNSTVKLPSTNKYTTTTTLPVSSSYLAKENGDSRSTTDFPKIGDSSILDLRNSETVFTLPSSTKKTSSLITLIPHEITEISSFSVSTDKSTIKDDNVAKESSLSTSPSSVILPKLSQIVPQKDSEKMAIPIPTEEFAFKGKTHTMTTFPTEETHVSNTTPENSFHISSTQISKELPMIKTNLSTESSPIVHHVSSTEMTSSTTISSARIQDTKFFHNNRFFIDETTTKNSPDLKTHSSLVPGLSLETLNHDATPTLPEVVETNFFKSSASPQFTATTSNPTSAATSSPFHQKLPLPTQNNEPAESKISDIQIEVYDSTLEPILAATNFKHSTDISNPSQFATTKHASNRDHSQERFTQYVVDKSSDFATQESSSVARSPGKPEPAAIEIHINVSEGFGNESEDLEFLYRQSDYRKFPSKKPINSLKPFDASSQNETSNEAAEEIVVEIIDGNSNSTENSASRENLNVNPVFTFRSDDDSQVELKNVKYYPEDRPKDGLKSTDDFFVPHVGQQPSSANKPLMDRDSDTIFYISNTEVKVGESLPTTNSYDTQMKKSRLESQFFPANYEERKKVAPQRYEEDIILSPQKNGPLKVIQRPLDISYVGESIMEVEQVTVVTTTIAPPVPGSTPDVIIEPAVLPEMAIGVPVIGELPPQIELKEIDYMPNFDGNKEESSIQYGGDLIDEGGAMGVGFDMDSYPLGNLGMVNKNSAAISSQMIFNHRMNHLKKDVLSADLAGSSETADGNDLLQQSNGSVNGTVIGEKMGNATAYSVMEDDTALDNIIFYVTLRTLIFVALYALIPLILVLLLLFIWRDYHRKYNRNPFNVMGRNSSTDPLDAEKGNGGGDGDVDGVETPEELRASSLAFGATTNSPSLEICSDSNEAINSNASDGDGRNCFGSNSNSREASDTTDVGATQAYNCIDVQEENSTLTVHCCNIESARPRQMESSEITPQSTTTTNAGAAAAGAIAATTSTANGPNPGTMHSNYSGPNGSITTMTLKNNHLIVETEERNDISRDTRVTKMHYDNSEKDGVFVVEVSRGADAKIIPSSPVTDPSEKRPFNIDADVKIVQNDTDTLLSNHEKVQVHPPPPQENLINHEEIDTNHLHQIDEVDEFEECPRFAKNSNTGLSQSDLSSSSSVDSNKRYSYGNQELYTIEQQDYTTPSPTATKAPHPHAESKHPQPENHNDDNGHPENGLSFEKSPPPAPKCDSSMPPPPSSDKVHDMNGHSTVVESKPKITAALLKQDTIVVNEVTNGSIHDNGNEDNDEASLDKPTIQNIISNGPAAETKTTNDYGTSIENGFDSIISLPDPPSTEEIKQMNDIILMETNQLDSLPPPPPPATDNHQHQNGNGSGSFGDEQNGDSHSIVSSESPMQTPPKVMKPLVPPTITVADTSAPTTTDIPIHTNGNCMTGHATSIAVEVSASS